MLVEVLLGSVSCLIKHGEMLVVVGNQWWPCRNKKNFVQVPSAVIFIDEIDALAKSRSSFGNNDERDQTLNQLLAEMDGFAVHNDVTMIVIAATNRPDVLDPAILRRFDRQVHVGYPDAKGREAILVVHANGVNCNIARIDWRLLAATTNGFSGADLRNVVNEAALMAVREQRPEIDQRHFTVAIDRVKRMKVSVQSAIANKFRTFNASVNLFPSLFRRSFCPKFPTVFICTARWVLIANYCPQYRVEITHLILLHCYAAQSCRGHGLLFGWAAGGATAI